MVFDVDKYLQLYFGKLQFCHLPPKILAGKQHHHLIQTAVVRALTSKTLFSSPIAGDPSCTLWSLEGENVSLVPDQSATGACERLADCPSKSRKQFSARRESAAHSLPNSQHYAIGTHARGPGICAWDYIIKFADPGLSSVVTYFPEEVAWCSFDTVFFLFLLRVDSFCQKLQHWIRWLVDKIHNLHKRILIEKECKSAPKSQAPPITLI